MKTKRSLWAVILSAALSLVLAGCSSAPAETLSTTSAAATAQMAEPSQTSTALPTESAPEDIGEGKSKILVAYFSHTGNTEEAAR